MRTRLKVCCIMSPEEARIAVAHGADAVGLVAEMPSGPGVIDEATIASIARAVPPAVGTFLLTSEADGEAIAAQVGRLGVNTVQIVRHVHPTAYVPLRHRLPAVRVVQVVHVEDRGAVDLALGYAGAADALLLDSGRPSADTAELGGTGRRHDWALSREIVARVPVPVFLAGGLTPETIGEAVATVRPFGVDLCTGLRTGGRLDPLKLDRFVRALREADGRLQRM